MLRGGRGRPGAGPVALAPPSERFHWLTAPRSDVLQSSPVHSGLAEDPAHALDDLFREYVLGARDTSPLPGGGRAGRFQERIGDGFRHRARPRRRRLEGGGARRGARLLARLALRHAAPVRRRLRRHGAAPRRTRRIRLGPGVLVPTNRIAPVAANGLASLNSSRPGASTSASAPASRRGSPWASAPMKLADLREYVRVVRGMLEARPSPGRPRALGGRSASSTPSGPHRLGARPSPPPLRLRAEGARASPRRSRRLDELHQRPAWRARDRGDAGVLPRRGARSRRRSTRPASRSAACCADGEDATARAPARRPDRSALSSSTASWRARSGARPRGSRRVDRVPRGSTSATSRPTRATCACTRGHLMRVRPEEERFVTPELLRDDLHRHRDELVDRVRMLATPATSSSPSVWSRPRERDGGLDRGLPARLTRRPGRERSRWFSLSILPRRHVGHGHPIDEPRLARADRRRTARARSADLRPAPPPLGSVRGAA